MRMGIPKVLTTDQGSEFKNHLNEELMQHLKIRHHLTTAYHPQVSFCLTIQQNQLCMFFAKVSTCRCIWDMDNEYVLPFICAGRRPG